MLSVEAFFLAGLFRSSHCSLRVTSVYLLHTNHPPYSSFTSDRVFTPLPYPHLIVGDFNLHHPLADPLRTRSDREYTLYAR